MAPKRFDPVPAQGHAMDDIVEIRVLAEDEEPPPDAVVLPAIEEMEPEVAVRHLTEYWGLGEADARYHLAIARGEIDGDAYPVDDNGEPVRIPRQDHTTV